MEVKHQSSSRFPSTASLGGNVFIVFRLIDREPLTQFVPLNLWRLQTFIQQGRIDASKPIDMKDLYDAKLVNNVKDGVKLLGGVANITFSKQQGSKEFNTPINITISQASK
jgi:hypothetical protein